ncbi:MAG TPA: pyruvate kinase [Methylomirabilota bacterium]|nr:pyruvate kinase [Methylomirabilota bacterium]
MSAWDVRPDGSDRRTKIVATIGPATSTEDGLRALVQAGMNVARLNFSHGTPEGHLETILRLRRLARALEVPIAILQDLTGPKVRIGAFAAGTVELRPGAPFTLTTREILGSPEAVSVSYARLPEAVAPEDRVLLADGVIELLVREVEGSEIRCTVVTGGTLSARKGLNVPSGLPDLPILGEKDLRDLRFGLQHDVDYVGLSFVRTAEDVRTAKREIAGLGGSVPVIAKIETRSALDRLDEILAEADGAMVARGDLSIETSFARVPIAQKVVIAEANRRAKPAITATQMLYSMVESPTPTRAEVADVANAIVDGSDALMLSEETAVGRHPVRAVQTMAAIAAETDRAGLSRAGEAIDAPGLPRTEHDAVVEAASRLAARLNVDVIATITRDGETARLAARYRPRQPILAITPRAPTFHRLALVRGVVPVLLPTSGETPEAMLEAARAVAHQHGWGGRQGIFVARDLVRCMRV